MMKETSRRPEGLSFRSTAVQCLRRLLRDRRERDATGLFVIEGPQLLADALSTHSPLNAVYVAADQPSPPVVADARAANVPVHTLAPGVLERVADTATPQPVLALARGVDVALSRLRAATLVVVCVDVRDPGNLGTVLRSAEAAGADGVVCCRGSVDLYSPKSVRASAGAIFRIPVVDGGDPGEVLDKMGRWGVRRLGTRPRTGRVYDALDLTMPTAFVIGNEAHGLDPHLQQRLDDTVSIPMAGTGDSLNVGVAAALLCFEAARQRRRQRSARRLTGSEAPGRPGPRWPERQDG